MFENIFNTFPDSRNCSLQPTSNIFKNLLHNTFVIDIDISSLSQAKENVEASRFVHQVNLFERDFKDLEQFTQKYDLIVSNPPFYEEDTLSGKSIRDQARHTYSLPFETLVENTSYLLLPHGTFCVIIPFQNASSFISLCAQNRLYLHQRLDVRSTLQKAFIRSLLAFTDSPQPSQTSTLTLYDETNNRTQEYTQLTQHFYI